MGRVELVKDCEAKEPVAPFSRGGPSPTKEFLEGVLARRMYFMARYNVFLVAPPLVVAEDEIEEGVRSVDGALDDIGA